MRFITESELRQLYRQEAFTTYTVPPNVRFTPEAHQFLVDRRIEVLREGEAQQVKQLAKHPETSSNECLWIELVEDKFDEVEAHIYLLQATSATYGNADLLDAISGIRCQLSQLRSSITEGTIWANGEDIDCCETSKGFSIYTYSVNHTQAELLGQLALFRSAVKGIQRELKQVTCTEEISSYRNALERIVHQIEYVIKHHVGGF